MPPKLATRSAATVSLGSTPLVFWLNATLVLIVVVLASLDLVAIEAYQAGGADNVIAGLSFPID